MSHTQLHTTYIYTIRQTRELNVYRSRRNPKLVIKVRTLSMMGAN